MIPAQVTPDQVLTGHKQHIVAVSDIHLGTLAPTVWYQPHLHEPYLVHLLRWVVDQADHIQELVLLGDIVDFWTYPADVRPPGFAEIAACHPAIFGLDGHLAAVLDALDGRVAYVPGNHDQGITADEVASIRSRGGHHVRLVEEVPYSPAPGLALAHGHHDTLFNAPTTTGPWAPLPLGYFVTRAVATRWSQGLGEGKTVAELAGQGAPNGIDLKSLAGVVSGVGARSVAATLIDFIAGATAMTPLDPIVLPDGSTATLLDVRAAYAECWTEWADAHGGGRVGQGAAARAALADFDGSYLGWFAQRMAFEHGADLVVMGHTHVPVGGLDGSLVNYVNTGFDCPSQPDLSRELVPQHVTFAVIDTKPPGAADGDADPIDAAIWAVEETDGAYCCHPIDVASTTVTHGTSMDFSCYVVVDNRHGAADLELVDHQVLAGTFVVPPPARIAAGAEGRFWVQDLIGAAGSSGTATYRRTDRPEQLVDLAFECPTAGTNSCRGPGAFATRAADGPWRDDRVAHWGHPFFVEFEIHPSSSA
ncbi:metallophosphoesterase [Aquihabitans sp. McL0605]|uniref:metallophosphoesterase n=1 Tax=Aquihabitans sp. McL0605 TaxID=3415671 RepID=UPI003CF7BAD3